LRPAWLAVLCVGALLGVLPGTSAAAQSCHLSDYALPSAGSQFRVRALATFASYRNQVYAGEYQGYGGSASFTHPWLAAEAALTSYRIVRNGLRDYGIGDLALTARAAAYRFDDEAALGVALAASLPTGDPRRGLGMGHTMLMPGAWFSWRREAWSISLDLAYGRVVAAEGHVHRPGGPLVSPMNRSEIEHAVAVSYTFWRTLFAAVRLYGAVPVADARGSARQASALALGGVISRFELGVEQHLPLVGAPFVAKTLLRVAVAL
jgi:hypothetical protein